MKMIPLLLLLLSGCGHPGESTCCYRVATSYKSALGYTKAEMYFPDVIAAQAYVVSLSTPGLNYLNVDDGHTEPIR